MKDIARVNRAEVEEGSLYEIRGEDGPLFCYCCGVVAHTDRGVFRHSTYVQMGHFVDPEDGCNRPNMNARDNARRFADKVEARGQIDLAYWEAVNPGPDLEERLAEYAREEELERQGFGR